MRLDCKLEHGAIPERRLIPQYEALPEETAITGIGLELPIEGKAQALPKLGNTSTPRGKS